MEHDESTAIQEKMDQDSGLKLTATQNVIRNKFKRAYSNRLEHEHDVSQAIKPITTTDELESKEDEISLQYLPEASSKPGTQHTAKNISKQPLKFRLIGSSEEKQQNPNGLCERLRYLLSLQIRGNMNHTWEINSIINELHKQKIII